jgi:vanillate O-demethylase ferredoxin subunit
MDVIINKIHQLTSNIRAFELISANHTALPVLKQVRILMFILKMD